MVKVRFFFSVLMFFCFSNLFGTGSSDPNRKKTVCLNMIVKNERSVITRCLKSVLPFIDTWVIVDTGSNDGTQEVIREFMKDIPGELYERPWINFAHNRNEALQLAKGKSDYILFMDADDVLTAEENFKMPDLSKDFYAILSRHPREEFWIHRLVKSDLPWFWEGVIHEDLLCERSLQGEPLKGLIYLYLHDGARGKDPDTLKKDIQVLLGETKKHPENPRNYFYLARSYMHIQDFDNALKYFQIRSQMKGNAEELFFAKLAVAKIHLIKNSSLKVIEKSCLEAYECRPQRKEPLYYLVRSLNQHKEFQKAYEVSLLASELPSDPNDYHNIESWVYEYGFLYELALSASHTNHNKEAIEACNKILAQKELPQEFRQDTERLLENIYRTNIEKIKKKLDSLFF